MSALVRVHGLLNSSGESLTNGTLRLAGGGLDVIGKASNEYLLSCSKKLWSKLSGSSSKSLISKFVGFGSIAA